MREWEARLRTKMLRFKENSSTVFFSVVRTRFEQFKQIIFAQNVQIDFG